MCADFPCSLDTPLFAHTRSLCSGALQAMAALAQHLRTSQAVEQLQAMGATLSNCVATLQVGAGRGG